MGGCICLKTSNSEVGLFVLDFIVGIESSSSFPNELLCQVRRAFALIQINITF